MFFAIRSSRTLKGFKVIGHRGVGTNILTCEGFSLAKRLSKTILNLVYIHEYTVMGIQGNQTGSYEPVL